MLGPATVAVEVVAALVAVLGIGCGPKVSQPIAFNHKLHIQDVGADCTDCHRYVLEGARATIPNIQVCGDCHEADATEPPEEVRLAAYLKDEEPIPWQKVTYVPEHVYFSHRRHAAIAKIECEICHGAMREREKPVTSLAEPLTMAACLDCHQRSSATTDCVWCHR